MKDERVNFCYVNIWLEELLKDNILVIVSLVAMAFSDDYRGSWRTLGWREVRKCLELSQWSGDEWGGKGKNQKSGWNLLSDFCLLQSS